MDPATLLMLLGAFYAMKTGLKAVKAGSHSSSSAAVPRSGSRRRSSSTTSTGGGMPRWLTPQRHTGSGWWAGEIGHGFPVFRSGVSEGWTHHQTAMHQRQAQTAKAKADGTARQLTYKQETEQHRQRIADAKQAAASGSTNLTPCPVCGLFFSHLTGYSCSGQPPANQPPATPAKPSPASQPGQPVMAPPPQPSSAGNGKSPGRGGQPAARPASPSGKPAGRPPAPSTGGSMDTTYESTEAIFEKILGLLDHLIDTTSVSDLQNLADALPTMLPDDSETVGHVADAAAAITEMLTAKDKAADSIQAAQTSHAAHNQASKEAADAQGGAPEREYVTGG